MCLASSECVLSRTTALPVHAIPCGLELGRHELVEGDGRESAAGLRLQLLSLPYAAAGYHLPGGPGAEGGGDVIAGGSHGSEAVYVLARRALQSIGAGARLG